MWVARWREDSFEPNGKPKRIRRSQVLGSVSYIPTRRQAQQLFAERLARVNSGEFRPQLNRTFRAFVREDWEPQTLPTLKHSTQKNYQYMLEAHLLPAFGDSSLGMISREAVQAFLMAKLRELSWGTVKRMRVVFGTLMGTAESWGYISENVVRKTKLPRRGPKPEKRILAPEEVRELLPALPEPTRSLVWLLVLTGLRIGELLALRWKDVDFTHRVIHVRQTVYEGHFDEPKTRSSNRMIPLGPKALAVLAARQQNNPDTKALVFCTHCGTPLNRRNLLRRQLTPTCKRLGLVGINWHSLRHSNATLLDAVGTPLGTVQALLGHASPQITSEVYLHSLPADARRAVEKVEEILLGPKWTQNVEIPKLEHSVIQ